mgnify:FL=1
MHLLLQESSILKLVHDGLEQILVLVLLFVDLVSELGVVVVVLVHTMLVPAIG